MTTQFDTTDTDTAAPAHVLGTVKYLDPADLELEDNVRDDPSADLLDLHSVQFCASMRSSFEHRSDKTGDMYNTGLMNKSNSTERGGVSQVPDTAAPVVAGMPIEVTPGLHVIPDHRVPMVPNVGIVVGERGRSSSIPVSARATVLTFWNKRGNWLEAGRCI
jgi:hypothetical protein